MKNNFPLSELLSIINDVKISFEQFDVISVVDNSTCIDRGQLLPIRFLQSKDLFTDTAAILN